MGLNAVKVLEGRYLRKDHNGKVIETPKQLFERVAGNVALADGKYGKNVDQAKKEFLEIMLNREFMPNSPTLMNAGTEIQQLSACFVLPVEDSMEGIFESVKHAAIIHKSGGGTGFSFTRLRAKGARVGTTGGVASGPISFMRVFDAATNVIKQGGKRRGANMGVLRVDHPDILDFITCKERNDQITNFNISVGITDKFVEAMKNNQNYDLIDPHSKKPVGELNAKRVFDLICTMAWKNGEPGVIFIDRMNWPTSNPTPLLGEIESTNPCGEQPLLPYESCNLGSINLANHITEDKKLDLEKLRKTIHQGVHFLDNVIDMNHFPIPKITEMVNGNRKIGLGVMGWADMLIKIGVSYDSEEAIKLADKVMEFINTQGRIASHLLALERGAFPNFKGSVYDNGNQEHVYRNATITTIAPTGTISIIGGCSSGIEPLFAISFIRKTPQFELLEVNPVFEEMARQEGFYTPELMMKIAQRGSIQDLKEIPEHIRKVFVTSMDLDPESHVRMQGAFQKHTDNAVSKTVNFPFTATVEDVTKVYLLAYQLGCKGITIYRDGSREVQVLNIKREEKKEEARQEEPANLENNGEAKSEVLTVDAEFSGGCVKCNL
ncbi:MAG: vitamin B12-dependent ribonucleotide reductase [Candidatus Woesearchaeota archaeon]